MLHKIKFLLFFIIINVQGYSQDVHFTQFFDADVYYNPAYSAFQIGTHSIQLNLRQQWWYARSPYNTFLFAYQHAMKPRFMNSSFFSWSLCTYYDVAGDAQLSTFRFSPGLSYALVLPNAYFSYVSIGIQPSLIQRSMDISRLTFDAQFDGYAFRPDAPINEYFQNLTFYRFDVNAGLSYCSVINQSTYFCSEFSVSHLTEPSVSWRDDDQARLKRKYVFISEALIPFQNGAVLPSIFYGRQGRQQELIMGLRSSFSQMSLSMDASSYYFRRNVFIGLFYRLKDAIIPYVGLQYFQYQFGLTYDINVSKYVPASRLRGGFEVFMSYDWHSYKKMRPKKIPCPEFF